MELVKLGKEKYLVKNSNGMIISEKEKLEMEKQNLLIEEITGNGCQKETIKKRKKVEKQIKELEADTDEVIEETKPSS